MARTITIDLLRCNTAGDDQEFIVDRNIAQYSEFIKEQIDRLGDETGDDVQAFVPYVKAKVLVKVIEYMKHYHVEPMTTITQSKLPDGNLTGLVQDWYLKFITEDMNVEMICELLVAAEYLRIWPLLDLASAALATFVKKKRPEEIKDMFGLKIPLRPISAAEEERIREEHSWCDEDWCVEA